MVNVPSFMVRVDSDKLIGFNSASPFAGGRPGRVKRKKMKNRGNDSDSDDDM